MSKDNWRDVPGETFDPYSKSGRDLAISYIALRMWQDLISRMGYQPPNKASFLAAVIPEIKKAVEARDERTEREGQRAEAPVSVGPTVGGQLQPGVPVDQVQDRPSCEDSWSCAAPRPFGKCPAAFLEPGALRDGHEFDGGRCIHCGADSGARQ